jgi:hypothetical protein
MLRINMLIAVMLSDNMLSVIILNVVAPFQMAAIKMWRMTQAIFMVIGFIIIIYFLL